MRYPGFILFTTLVFFGQVRGQTNSVPATFHSPLEKQILLAYQINHQIDPLALLLVADKEVTAKQYEQVKHQLTQYIEELQEKKSCYSRDATFIRYVFEHTHQQYLKKFAAYQPFSKVFSTGVYNCVSATALFALLLKELRYSYQVYETPFHLYLIVRLSSGKKLLLESTDPIQGVLAGKRSIRNREIYYGEPDSTSWCVKAALCAKAASNGCPTRYLNPISLTELCGLQYYNQAVLLYNQLRLREATQWLHKAVLLYPTARRIQGLQEYIHAEQVKSQTVQTSYHPSSLINDRK